MNLPNKISITRICLIPLIIFLFFATFIPYGINYFACAFVFAVAAYTDALDGHIARKYNLVTTLGKFLDSIADKLLATVSLILLANSGLINGILSSVILIIIVCRDLIIDMLRQICASKNIIVAADWFGKIKTIVMDIALPILFVSYGLKICGAGIIAFNIVFYVGFILLLLATLLSLLSGINYLIKNRSVFLNN